MHGDECGDEQLGDRFEIDPKLMQCHIAAEVAFMHATKLPQIRAQARPHPFTRIRMRFARAIAIGIARPFACRVAHRGVWSLDRGIAGVLVGVDVRSWPTNTNPRSCV